MNAPTEYVVTAWAEPPARDAEPDGTDRERVEQSADAWSERYGEAYTVWGRRADSRQPWTERQTYGRKR